MKLQAKGGNEYTRYHHRPAERASAETEVILAAFRYACDYLVSRSQTHIEQYFEELMASYVEMRELRQEFASDLERIDVSLAVIGNRLTSLGGNE